MATKLKDTFKCQSCHRELPTNKSGGTGYGITKSGKKICYECAGKAELKEIAGKSGGDKHTFYLIKKDGKVVISNWPGSYQFPVHSMTSGKHNMAGKRLDVWFKDHMGHEWHGINIGDNDLVRAVKIKKPASGRTALFRKV
jgi:hypothetical protein